jgi:hypothetical protein
MAQKVLLKARATTSHRQPQDIPAHDIAAISSTSPYELNTARLRPCPGPGPWPWPWALGQPPACSRLQEPGPLGLGLGLGRWASAARGSVLVCGSAWVSGPPPRWPYAPGFAAGGAGFCARASKQLRALLPIVFCSECEVHSAGFSSRCDCVLRSKRHVPLFP